MALLLILLACRQDPQVDTNDPGMSDSGGTDTTAGCVASEEICDGLDNDCDNQIDEGLREYVYADADGDGYGDPDQDHYTCEPMDGVANGLDCDDTDPDVNPDAVEICDWIDQDCDGQSDEGVTSVFHRDWDGDGYGDPSKEIVGCGVNESEVLDATDCDDHDADAWPGNPEVCDAVDNDCNGQVDEGVKTTFYGDVDGDGWGNDVTEDACEPPSGFTTVPGDCDDADALVSPDADEVCNAVDDDCDGTGDDIDGGTCG